MASLKNILRNPAKIVYVLDKMRVSKWIPDKPYLKLKYRANFGKKLNLENPQTFNEKLQWLKLYDRKPEYIPMVDKYEAKRYVADRIGEEYIIPTLGLWDRVEDIDFDALPDKFVLKCTHDSGGVVICKNKSDLNITETKAILAKALKNNFFYQGREWPYKMIKPRIIAETYLEDTITEELRDYKFYCFNGVVEALVIASDRQKKDEEIKLDLFDVNFEHLGFRQGYPNATVPIQKPKTFDQMKILAGKLSQGFPQLRVDFYEADGKLYFGELTFFDGCGFVAFEPTEWDNILGSWIKLPEKK